MKTWNDRARTVLWIAVALAGAVLVCICVLAERGGR